MLVSVSSYLSLPQKPGVYFFLDKENTILYVGKAKDLRKRVTSYFSNTSTLYGKTKILVSLVKKIKVTVVDSEVESLLLEANYIKKYLPKYNIKLIDGKAYPLIRIATSPYPAVVIARKEDDHSSRYFGPYPHAKDMYMVLRLLRKIFPFHSVLRHPKKICLYYHLGLCPCLPVHGSSEQRLHYKKTITNIIHFLQGNTKKVLQDLCHERDLLSKQELYEQALSVQQQIDAVNRIIHPIHAPLEYEVNPHLRSDIRQQELTQLREVLRMHKVEANHLTRIECYDISNTQGKNPTASMVVLLEGDIEKSAYRKFKMKTSGPNDFAMMQEVLTRRFNHPEWGTPDLIIVDGGKGQISSAYEIVSSHNIPLVGLAKREETIITSDFQEIRLVRSSPALQLVMRIRDEAHRFAITYHKKLRSQATFS